MPLPKIEAVIFDMDGLMIDSERIAQQAWTEAAREWGYPFEPAHYLHVTGITVRDAEKKFKEIFGADFPFYEIRARRSELVEASFQEHGIPLKPGLLALLEALKSRAIPRAVATSAGHKYAIDKLTRAGLLDWFDTLVGGDQITHGKPHPEIFLSAAAKLGADPARCLVLEDSEAGIRAAHAAGMIPVMVPDRKAPSAEVRRLAWQVVETLDEVREMIAERGVRSAD